MASNDSLELSSDGRPLLIGRPGLEIHFNAARRVQALRGQWFEDALRHCGGLEGEPLHAALALAFERHQRIVKDDDIAEWLDSPEGAVFVLWHALREFQPEFTEEHAREVYESLDGEQLARIAGFFTAGLRGSFTPTRNNGDELIEVAQ